MTPVNVWVTLKSTWVLLWYTPQHRNKLTYSTVHVSLSQRCLSKLYTWFSNTSSFFVVLFWKSAHKMFWFYRFKHTFIAKPHSIYLVGFNIDIMFFKTLRVWLSHYEYFYLPFFCWICQVVNCEQFTIVCKAENCCRRGFRGVWWSLQKNCGWKYLCWGNHTCFC